MTIATTTRRNDYPGNDTTLVYNYTFKIFAEDDVRVIILNTATDTETTLVKDTDYTVQGVNSPTGGTITLLDAGQDWISTGGNFDTGFNLTIKRQLELLQETDIRNQGDFFPEVHEDTFDRLIMIDLQQQDESDRSLKMPESVDPAVFDSTFPPGLPDSPGATVVVNPGGDGFDVGPTATEITSAVANATAQASNAATSASNAATSASNAATSEANAATSEANAAVSEANAAVSEANAAASAASIGSGQYVDVQYKTFADSPITIVDGDKGTLYEVDCSGGPVVFNLPQVSALADTSKWHIGIKKNDATVNDITINRSGTDTINGSVAVTAEAAGGGYVLIPDSDPAPDNWSALAFGFFTVESETVNITGWVDEPGGINIRTTNGELGVGYGSPTNSFNNFRWRRVGDSLEGEVFFGRDVGYNGGVTGSPSGTSGFIVEMPAGLKIDTTKTSVFTQLESDNTYSAGEVSFESIVGMGHYDRSVQNWSTADIYIIPYSADGVRVFQRVHHQTNMFAWNAVNTPIPPTGTTTDKIVYTFRFKVPIQGWTAKDNVIVTAANSNATDFQNYSSPNTQGFGTLSSSNLRYRRVGDSMEIKGHITTGTPTATEARITLPASLTVGGLTTSESKVGSFLKGTASSTLNDFSILAKDGDDYITFGAASSTVSPLVNRNGDEIAGASEKIAVDVSVPISGWTSEINFLAGASKTGVQAYIIEQDGANLLTNTAEWEFDLNTASIKTGGVEYIQASNPGGVSTIFTALQRCVVQASCAVQITTSGSNLFLDHGAKRYKATTSEATGTGKQHQMSMPIILEAGESFSFRGSNSAVANGTDLVVSFTAQAI